jgi:hypothetical protein
LPKLLYNLMESAPDPAVQPSTTVSVLVAIMASCRRHAPLSVSEAVSTMMVAAWALAMDRLSASAIADASGRWRSTLEFTDNRGERALAAFACFNTFGSFFFLLDSEIVPGT